MTTKIEIELTDKTTKGKGKDPETVAEEIAKSLERVLSRLGFSGVGKAVGSMSGGESSDATEEAVSGGVESGVVATGVVSAIVGILSVLHVFEPVMKLLKIILMLFFLPLLPFIKEVMMGLADFAKTIAPASLAVMQAVQGYLDSIDTGFTVIKDIVRTISDGIGSFVSNVVSGIWDSLGTIPVFKDIENVLTAIGSVLGLGATTTDTNTTPLTPAQQSAQQDLISKATPASTLTSGQQSAYNNLISTIGSVKPSTTTNPSTGDMVNSVLKSVVSNIPSMVTNLVSTVVGIPAVGNLINTISSIGNLFGGKKQSGSKYIASDQFAMLHKGERVMSATEGGAGKSFSMNIKIDKPTIRSDEDIKELVRRINREQQINLRRYVSYTH